MSDVTSETQTEKTFDPEAFAMNLARAMESSGQALAAYLKPRENGDPKDKPPSELTEVVKTFSTVAEYWLSDKARISELQMKMGKAYLICSSEIRAALSASRRRRRSNRLRATSDSRTPSGNRTSFSIS